MKTYIEICKAVRKLKNTDDLEPVAKLIYENVFQRDSRYRDWKDAVYQAPETSEGFAYFLSFYVANEIAKLKI